MMLPPPASIISQASGNGVLGCEHHALEVDVQHVVPDAFFDVGGRPRAGDAHVVEQDMQGSVAFNRRIGDGLAVYGQGDVRADDGCFAALFADGGQGFLGGLRVAVHQQHLGSLAGEQDGGGLSSSQSGTTGAGARDDGDFSFEAQAAGRHERHNYLRVV